MTKINFIPTFVKTKNVRNFEVLMDGLALGAGEGRLGMVISRAGRGKTRTCQWYAAHQSCTYLRMIGPMLDSEAEFLEGLCRAMEIRNYTRRRGAMFGAIVDRLGHNPHPVFIDEVERAKNKIVELVRDLSDISTAPFVMVGEEELETVMKRNRRVWSRTFQRQDFEAISAADIIFFVKESAGLHLSATQANIAHEESKGDWRDVKRAALALVQQVNANSKPDISDKMVRLSFKVGLQGGK